MASTPLIKEINCFQTIENLKITSHDIKASSPFVVHKNSPPGVLTVYGVHGNPNIFDQGAVRVRYINITGNHVVEPVTEQLIYMEARKYPKTEFEGPFTSYSFSPSTSFDITKLMLDGNIELVEFSISSVKLDVELKKCAMMHCGFDCPDVMVEMFDLSRISCGRVGRGQASSIRWVVDRFAVMRHESENRIEGVLVKQVFAIDGIRSGVIDVVTDRNCVRQSQMPRGIHSIPVVYDLETAPTTSTSQQPDEESVFEEFMPSNIGLATYFPEFRFHLAPPRVRRTPRVSQAVLDASFRESVDRQFANSIDLSTSFALPDSKKKVRLFPIEQSGHGAIEDKPPKRDSQPVCTICMENAACVEAIPCGHNFACNSCADTHSYLNNRCPQCRATIKSAIVRRVDSEVLNYSFDLFGLPSEPLATTPSSQFACKECGKNESNVVYSCGDRSDCSECCIKKRSCEKAACSICQKLISSAIILK